MDENTNEVEAVVTDEELAAFDDWNDNTADDGFDLTDGDGQEGSEPDGQPEEPVEGEETEGEAEEPGAEDEEGNQLFEITYLGNKEQLTLDKMTEYAQKGRDYDHVREERDGLKQKYAGAERQMEFLQKLADKAGVSVEEQIDLTEAMWLMDEEAAKGNDISESEALLRVQRGRKETKREPEPEKVAEQDEGSPVNPQVARFMKAYPEISATDIPKEVWEDMQTDGDLLRAYQEWEIKQLKAEQAKLKQEAQNVRNESRSTGARRTAGANTKKDDFDEGWDS